MTVATNIGTLDNFRRNHDVYFGDSGALGRNIHAYFYCDPKAVPTKVGHWPNGKPFDTLSCPVKNAIKGRAAVTFWFQNGKISEQHVLLCPLSLDSPYAKDLQAQEKRAKDFPSLRTVIDSWSQAIRGVIYYHEVMHFKRVSDPWCGGDEVYDAGKIVQIAKNPQEYDRSLQNAHSWVCQAIILSKTIIFTRFLDPRCSFNVDDAKMERHRRADAEGHAGKRRGTERSSWPRGYNNARLRQRP